MTNPVTRRQGAAVPARAHALVPARDRDRDRATDNSYTLDTCDTRDNFFPFHFYLIFPVIVFARKI